MQSILSFDYGDLKIGVAVGNSHTRNAQELVTITNHKATPDWSQLDRLISEWNPALLVVGLPLNMDGSENTLCERVKSFGNALSQRYNLEVLFEDERLSSNQADGMIRESHSGTKGLTKKLKSKRDQTAAKLILQSYFERI